MRRWTIDDLLAEGAVTPLVVAGEAVYRCGKNTVWDKFHKGTLDFPTIKVGRRVLVPTAALVALLRAETSEAGASTPAAATITSSAAHHSTGGSDDDSVRHLRRVG